MTVGKGVRPFFLKKDMRYSMYLLSFSKTHILPASSGSHIGASAFHIAGMNLMVWVGAEEHRTHYRIDRTGRRAHHMTGMPDLA